MAKPSLEPYDPQTLGGSKYGELLADKLNAEERTLCWLLGMERASSGLLMIPIVGTFLEFKKRFFVVALTNQRLILVEMRKPFFQCNEKQTMTYPLGDVEDIQVDEYAVLSSVSITLKDSHCRVLRDVQKKAATALSSTFKSMFA